MEAFVSGQAARVVFVEGMDVSYIEADDPKRVLKIRHTDIHAILGGASDVERIIVDKHEDVFGRLLEKYNFDRCFRMLDIAVSDDEGTATRISAAEAFSEIALDSRTYESIKNYSLACYNSDIHFSNEIADLFKGNQFFLDFLSELVECQIHILSFDEALKKSFASNQIDQDVSAEFRHRAIDTGLFRKVVEAKRDGNKVEDAVLHGYLDLQDISSSRLILQGWTKQFLAQKSKRSLKQLESDFESYSTSDYQPREHDERNRYQTYLAVQRQQDVIIEKLMAGEKTIARRFTGQMIKSQISSGDTEYAAKSLTKLATEARRLGLHSIELEWAKQATELAPEDGIAMGMLADTYLNLYRFPDAERAFTAAVKMGDSEFGTLGLARMQRMSGDPVGALAALEKIKDLQPHQSPHAIHFWQGYCGTLKDLYQLDEALSAIDEACKHFPNESSLMCIRANILFELGEFEASLEAYGNIVSLFPNESTPRCGKAWVLCKIGELQSALPEFEEVTKRFPNEVNGHIGRATVLRDMGKHTEALEAFIAATKKFPHSPATFCGIAETHREMGNLPNALSAYDKAIQRFELEIVARNGRANILKTMGEFQRALQEYDRNVKDFPYNLYALNGRADLLRRLGEYDDAIKAYDTIIDRHPKEGHARVAKSAILVAQKRFDEALELLSTDAPKTEDDWVGFHIRGIAALYQGEFDAAAKIFERGVSESPFYGKRHYFQSALAATKMRKLDFSGAASLLSNSKDPVSNLLLVHSLSELGRTSEAAQALDRVEANLGGALGLLHIELGARYKLTIGKCKHDEQWIFERESEAFLQAA